MSPQIKKLTPPKKRGAKAKDAGVSSPGILRRAHSKEAAKREVEPLIHFRPYQLPVFLDRTTGVQILHWSRQIGKSFTLAAWAVDRLLTRPGRLVTVLSNSKDNGAEFAMKAAEVCRLLGQAFEMVDGETALDDEAKFKESPVEFEAMRFEIRITVGGRTGRIKVLAANPRTARGFSGDLILDEFAFHEDSAAIWEAAEPILSSNPDFLCRIASTGNGKHNLFYSMATSGDFEVVRVTRTDAWKQGIKIYHPRTRQPITPDEARKLSTDKRAHDQNYECAFADENSILLTTNLINAAEREEVGVICEGDWSAEALRFLREAKGDLFFGLDVGRYRNISVLAVGEELNNQLLIRALLRMEGMRLPDQQARLGVLFDYPKLKRGAIDMTGIGLGLCEYAQDAYGAYRIHGVNFSSSVPMTSAIKASGRKGETVRVTEAMATELLQRFEDRRILIPRDAELRDDLRKPEKVVSPGGRVSIAAARDIKNHADHFWSLALMTEAAAHPDGGLFVPVPFPRNRDRQGGGRDQGVLV